MPNNQFVLIAILYTMSFSLRRVSEAARRWAVAVLFATAPATVPAAAQSAPALAAPAPTAPRVAIDHSAFDGLLRAHVTDGLVDYDAFRDAAAFRRYLASLERASLAGADDEERLAFWINVYNAYTIQLLNSRKQRNSIRDINKVLGVTLKSPWAEPIVKADRRTLTLDDVEHEIIRKQFKDPRIHVALVCAAMGCPPLRSEAFTADRVDAQLDDQARRFLAQRAKNRVDVPSGTVYGSPIFTWYREDFGGTLEGVGAFWARYVPAGPEQELLRSGKFRWVDTEYDWRINMRR